MIDEITPQEAKEKLSGDEGYRYLDVRSVGEFVQGHPPGAVNVPILETDPETGMMAPNEQFFKVVNANFSRDDAIIIGCLYGPRATRAAQMLDEAGFSRCVVMRGGFGGERDPAGEIINVGWKGLGYQIETDNPEGNSYESLRNKLAAS